MSLAIHHKDLPTFVADLLKSWPVFGPSEGGDSGFRFIEIKSYKDLSLNYGQTILPPKKYVIPPSEILFKFRKNKLEPAENQEIIIFGIKRRDGEGLFYLDEIMKKPIPDETYRRRRDKTRLVVIDSLAPSNNLHCDLYLQKVDKNHYFVFPFSDFGEKLIKNSYFIHEKSVGTISTRHLPDEIIYHPRLDQIVDKSKNHPIWEKLAETCFNCGICTYVCPLCYCFNTEDEFDISKNIGTDCQGCRKRNWDSCMLSDFGKVTFHNFRPEIKDRIYNWYYHKFVRMPREFGFPGCNDCGRCITYCPAKINFREVLKRLIDDEKTKK